MQTPVLFLVFNKPDTTLQVWNQLRQIKPSYLFVACDGPREKRESDLQNIQKVKDIISSCNWPCEIKTLYREKNLGCKMAVSSAITWFFDHVDKGIIIEDDCLPNASFFTFCEELLAYYEHDSRIFQINGCNHEINDLDTGYDYYFTHLSHIWGWATWKRAWKYFDLEMKHWAWIRDSDIMERLLGSETEAERRKVNYENTFNKRNDSWAYIWAYSVMTQNGLSIAPARNLVKNIGSAHINATHTLQKEKEFKVFDMQFPLKHPAIMVPRFDLDEIYTQRHAPKKQPQKDVKMTPAMMLKLGLKRILGKSSPGTK